MKKAVVDARTKRHFWVLPIIAGIAAAGVVQPALAVDRTWFGDTGDWGVASNWSPAGVLLETTRQSSGTAMQCYRWRVR
jgi:hypothetical protein